MQLHKYIAKNNPENAARFINRMIDFGESLGILPEKFPRNRFQKYAKHKYYTAVFEKNYIFFYKIKNNILFICNVINTSRLK
jgi:hypothetical protein